MIPPVAVRNCSLSSKIHVAEFLVAVVLMLAPATAFAQHGGHVGGGHVSASPHVSAPPPSPRAAAPRPAPRPPVAVAPPRGQNSAVVHPAPRILVPPNSVAGSVSTGTNAIANQGSPAIGTNTIGFPRTTVFPQSGRPLTSRSGVTFNGDGHSLWVTRTPEPGLGSFQTSRVIHGGPRRFWPLPRRTRPIYYPIFYPFGLFGGYPGFGFGACDPFWGWNFGCEGFGFGNYYGDAYSPMFSYDGPAEPNYIPVPSDESTVGEQDEAVLYLNDGTVYLISDYWLADNKIHYVTSDGAEHTIDLDQVDLQKSVDVNAKRGVTFTLRPSRAEGDAPQDNLPASPANGQDNANPQPQP
jgi:hypothetical protein